MYLRTFNQAGFVDQLMSGLPCFGGACNLGSATAVNFGPSEKLTGFDFALQPGSAIAGQVRGVAGGMPIEGATVELYSATGIARWGDYRLTTQADGRFRSYGMAEGIYHLVVTVPAGRFAGRYVYGAKPKPGVWTRFSDGTPIVLDSAAGVAGIDIVLDSTAVHFDGFE